MMIPRLAIATILWAACAEPVPDDSPAGSGHGAGKVDGLTALPVGLVYADIYNTGCADCLSGFAWIEVANSAFPKQVALVHTPGGGAPERWIPAAFSASLPDGRELWVADGMVDFSGDFAIRYAVAGEEYWDDNAGLGYRLREDEVGDLGRVAVVAPLGPGRAIAVTYMHMAHPALLLTMFVRNDASDKTVGIAYSFDGWKTVDTAAASYDRGLGIEVEQWELSLAIPPTAMQFDFAAFVSTRGAEYRDDNFGNEFSCFRPSRWASWLCNGLTTQ